MCSVMWHSTEGWCGAVPDFTPHGAPKNATSCSANGLPKCQGVV